MKFAINEKASPVKHRYKEEDIRIATEFAKRVYKELPKLIKAIVVFGSAARSETVKNSDVDILIVIDDVHIILTPEMLETYKIIVDKIMVGVSQRIHIVTLKFTTFWEYVRAGDPIAINILRDGAALIDSGFFDPLQALLYMGRIRPTPESINSYYSKAPATMFNSKWHILQATIDLYWSAIDASHAALMSQGFIPPSPAHVPDMMESELVKKKHLEKRYVDTMRLLYDVMKKITHREISYVSGAEYDKYRHQAQELIDRMRAFVK